MTETDECNKEATLTTKTMEEYAHVKPSIVAAATQALEERTSWDTCLDRSSMPRILVISALLNELQISTWCPFSILRYIHEFRMGYKDKRINKRE